MGNSFDQIKELRKTINLDLISKEEKKLMLKDLYVMSPKLNAIKEAIKYCHHESKYLANPLCMCVVGDAGVGKSLLCKNYTKDYPAYNLELDDKKIRKVPVINAIVPSTATEKSIATSLLEALGDQFYLQGTTDAKTFRFKQLVKPENCGVELIIIDEVQHIYDRDSQRIIQKASNWIKNLITMTCIPVVLVGLPDLLQVVESNEQLSSRFKYREKIKPFSIETLEGEKEFRTFLHIIDLKLPTKERSNLSDPKTMQMLFDACQGNTRTLMEQIIYPAVLKAIDFNCNTIDFNLLQSEVKRINKSQKIKLIDLENKSNNQIKKKALSKSSVI